MVRFGLVLILAVVLCCTTVLSASEGEPTAEGQSPFAGSLGDAIWTVVAFVLLLVVLGRFAWKPILSGLAGRADYIAKQISDAEATKAKAEETLANYRAKLADSEKEGRSIIAAHVKKGTEEADRIVTAAENRSEEIKLKLELELERARRQARSDLLDEAGGIVLRLSEEVLGRVMSDEDHRKLIDQAVESLRQEKGAGNV